MKIGVVTFPGSLDDGDARRAARMAGAEPVALWHGDTDLHAVDAVVLPGGFSYGDYLRAGAIAGVSPIMSEVAAAAERGMPVLGVCNGFQILCEAGLLPGGLIRNSGGRFRCVDLTLAVVNNRTAWTADFERGEHIVVPLKNMDGCYVADRDTLAHLEGEGQVVFRYASENPNGSVADIAGVCNAAGNVVGLMPHPEHAIEPGFGPDTATAMRSGVDGLRMFHSVVAGLLARA